eukprot:TRINITY_DN21663_c1_g1_i1.p1 TRINITY_DN21663_c1_g1~~TRINITY_DN21663_c1_g1_i1.p1  ORF type:complete len:715 (+),score=194.43 TRINITY_DN21663_c1_g1_i1:622-2766(+)
MNACLEDGQRMVALCPLHPLGYVRCAEALSSMKEVVPSIEQFHKAAQLLPNVSDEEVVDLSGRIAKGMNFNMKQQMSARINPRKKFDVYFIDEARKLRKETLARNFSWVLPGQLAGMSVPERRDQIEALKYLNVRLIFTVMDESPLPKEFFEGVDEMDNIHHPVRNYGAPTVDQVDDFIARTERMLEDKLGAVLVHCGGGKGRAGTFLSCWLAKHGKKKYDPDENDSKDDYTPPAKLTAKEAIDYLREIRPGSVETTEQENFVAEYVQILWRRSEKVEKKEDDLGSQSPLSSERKKKMRLSPKVVIAVGLPGCGKSTFGNQLEALNPHLTPGEWIRICQDEIGSADAFDSAVQDAAKRRDKRLFIDRCNVKKSDRKRLVDLLRSSNIVKSAKGVVVVYFDVPMEVCQQRVATRKDHPTIPQSKGKSKTDRIVESFAKQLEPPSKDEEFGEIHTLSTDEEMKALLIQWGCDSSQLESLGDGDSYFKFPRTHHLLDAGGSGVSRDDLLLDSGEQKEYFGRAAKKLTIQEKVDGANLGISITKDYELRCQNRSHFVNHESGSQWARLFDWLEMHKVDLYNILEPERHILFGEWCFAKHSIHYSHLPDYFLAFDIYDKKVGKFLSYSKVCEMLAPASFPVHTVPVIAQDVVIKSREEMLALLDTKSTLHEGFVEGIYLRIEEGDYLSKRCKLVRPDFIQNIEDHWMKQTMVKNSIKFD